MMIPDAPCISEAESRGTDYMYEFVFGSGDDDEDPDEYEEYDDEPCDYDLEVGFDPYEGCYTFDC